MKNLSHEVQSKLIMIAQSTIQVILLFTFSQSAQDIGILYKLQCVCIIVFVLCNILSSACLFPLYFYAFWLVLNFCFPVYEFHVGKKIEINDAIMDLVSQKKYFDWISCKLKYFTHFW